MVHVGSSQQRLWIDVSPSSEWTPRPPQRRMFWGDGDFSESELWLDSEMVNRWRTLSELEIFRFYPRPWALFLYRDMTHLTIYDILGRNSTFGSIPQPTTGGTRYHRSKGSTKEDWCAESSQLSYSKWASSSSTIYSNQSSFCLRLAVLVCKARICSYLCPALHWDS